MPLQLYANHRNKYSTKYSQVMQKDSISYYECIMRIGVSKPWEVPIQSLLLSDYKLGMESSLKNEASLFV